MFDKYDNLCRRQLKEEIRRRGLPIQQNKAAWKLRVVCRLDDQGKIPPSIKYLPMGTKKMPEFEDLLNRVHNNFYQNEFQTLSAEKSVPSVSSTN